MGYCVYLVEIERFKGTLFGKYLKKDIKIILIEYLKVFKMNFI